MPSSSDLETQSVASNLPQVSKFAGESFGADNVRTVYVGAENPLLETSYLKPKEECEILIIGLDGTSKSRLIDALCNVFYGIDYKTPFRAIIANAQFDSSTPCKTITKYVFAGTRFSFQPVLIDTPDLGNGTENVSVISSLLSEYLNNDSVPTIHAVAFVLPDAIGDLDESVLNRIKQILSVLPTSMVTDLIPLLISLKVDSKVNNSDNLLRQLNIFDNKTFSVNLSSLYCAPSENPLLSDKQEHHYTDFVQKLTLFMLHVKRLTPKSIDNHSDTISDNVEPHDDSNTSTLTRPSEPRHKTDSIAESTTDSSVFTVVERKIDGFATTRPTSLNSLTDYTYFPSTGWIPKPRRDSQLPGSIDGFNFENGLRPLQRCSNNSRTMNPMDDDFESARIVMDADTMVPRVVSPFCENGGNLIRFSSFKTTSDITTLSETPSHSRVDFTRDHGSGRSTASEWTYIPSNSQTTFNSHTFNGIETLKPPPKPPRVVDPEFRDDEICPAGTLPRVTDADDDCLYGETPAYKKIQTRGFYPKRVPVPMKQGWGDTSIRSKRSFQRTTRPQVEATRLQGVSPLLRRNRLRAQETPFSSEQKSFFDCSQCLFYCLAPVFLTLVVVAVFLMVIFLA